MPTQRARYALHAMLFLAGRDGSATVAEIAEAEELTSFLWPVPGLILGGLAAAPLAGDVTKLMPVRQLTITVGVLISLLAMYQTWRLQERHFGFATRNVGWAILPTLPGVRPGDRVSRPGSSRRGRAVRPTSPAPAYAARPCGQS